MVPLLAGFIRQWQEQTPYGKPTDWVFASARLKGKQPRVANMLVEDYLRPAAVKAGVLKDGEKVRFAMRMSPGCTLILRPNSTKQNTPPLYRGSPLKVVMQANLVPLAPSV